MKETTTAKLVKCALLVAIATGLSLFQPFELPFGGGITIASMMPIILIAFCYGLKWGLFSAFVFSILQMVVGMKTVAAFFLPGDSQMLVWQAICICLIDYVLAYTVLGFGGIFKKYIKNKAAAICAGTVFALLLRYVMHIISGYIFFGSWAEWFFTQEGFYAIGATIMEHFSGWGLALLYSVFYNGLYMIPEIIITAIVTPVIYKVLVRANVIAE